MGSGELEAHSLWLLCMSICLHVPPSLQTDFCCSGLQAKYGHPVAPVITCLRLNHEPRFFSHVLTYGSAWVGNHALSAEPCVWAAVTQINVVSLCPSLLVRTGQAPGEVPPTNTMAKSSGLIPTVNRRVTFDFKTLLSYCPCLRCLLWVLSCEPCGAWLWLGAGDKQSEPWWCWGPLREWSWACGMPQGPKATLQLKWDQAVLLVLRDPYAFLTKYLANESGTDHWRASHVALVVKNLPANAGDIRDTGSIPGSGRFLGERFLGEYPHQYSCLENPHGQRRLVGCSP